MMIYYKNTEMQQNTAMPAVFERLLKRENFSIVIEIGTRTGALTRFLKDVYPSCNLYTFDIQYQIPTGLNISDFQVRIKNIFSPDFESVIDAEALTLLGSDAKKLILCDGGNKIKEFNCLAKYIKIGDVIMAHDYAQSKEYFEKELQNKIWNWCEITEADIKDISEKCGLVAYDQVEFQKAVWACKIKVE